MHAVRKYLVAWAEPEAALASALDGGYARCLVVPACGERASLLDGYLRAAATSPGRTLCILVVNGRDGASAAHHADNAALLAELGATLAGVRVLGSPSSGRRAFAGTTRESALDVLVIDRASEGARFPEKTGVGLARKIGIDVALAVHVERKVESALVFCTDADVALPERHFERPELGVGIGGAVFPFWHEPCSDEAVTRVTALYELSLRYYVAGLAAAGSPYAFHTLGSAMAVDGATYAAVRGAPDREAGEDFYLLAKVAKLSPVVRTGAPVIRVRSRASDRTPFGTGAIVACGVAGRERLFYAPETFEALARWLRALEGLAEDGSVERFFAARGGLREHEWNAVAGALLGARARARFAAAARDATSTSARRVRLHDWFDAFRTLKLVHALRDAIWPDVSFADALSRAPFTPPSLRTEAASVDAHRAAFLEAESRTPGRLGPKSLSR